MSWEKTLRSQDFSESYLNAYRVIVAESRSFFDYGVMELDKLFNSLAKKKEFLYGFLLLKNYMNLESIIVRASSSYLNYTRSMAIYDTDSLQCSWRTSHFFFNNKIICKLVNKE